MASEPVIATNPWRYAAVLGFVALWMTCGWLLRLEVNAYLILGVPLTVLFQSAVRRLPLPALWVRDVPPFRLRWKGIVIAAGLAIVPFAGLMGSAFQRDGIGCLFSLCSIAGAVGAAYALRHFRREHLRPLAWCLLITLCLDAIQWSLFLGLRWIEMHPIEGGLVSRVLVGIISLLEYMAVVFAMEEVTFRMLDSHLKDGSQGLGILSAVLISAAWGLWHLPISGDVTWQSVAALLALHVPYGVCLSLFWRKTGNLVVPGLAHALGDAIRNAITVPG